MFSGIVQGQAKVCSIKETASIVQLGIAIESREGLQKGASIAINGVCLTVTHWDEENVYFDVMAQSMRVTNLKRIVLGSDVNYERSFKYGQELGGHIVSGHVDAMASIVKVDEQQADIKVWYQTEPAIMKYLMTKGFVALDGCSLTLVDVLTDEAQFSVCYIPETLSVTSHGDKSMGRLVNVEVDRQTQAIVDTVEAVMARQAKAAAI